MRCRVVRDCDARQPRVAGNRNLAQLLPVSGLTVRRRGYLSQSGMSHGEGGGGAGGGGGRGKQGGSPASCPAAAWRGFVASACRGACPVLWVVSEVGAMATDLAGLLGAAIGCALFLGTSLLAGALIAAGRGPVGSQRCCSPTCCCQIKRACPRERRRSGRSAGQPRQDGVRERLTKPANDRRRSARNCRRAAQRHAPARRSSRANASEPRPLLRMSSITNMPPSGGVTRQFGASARYAREQAGARAIGVAQRGDIRQLDLERRAARRPG